MVSRSKAKCTTNSINLNQLRQRRINRNRLPFDIFFLFSSKKNATKSCDELCGKSNGGRGACALLGGGHVTRCWSSPPVKRDIDAASGRAPPWLLAYFLPGEKECWPSGAICPWWCNAGMKSFPLLMYTRQPTHSMKIFRPFYIQYQLLFTFVSPFIVLLKFPYHALVKMTFFHNLQSRFPLLIQLWLNFYSIQFIFLNFPYHALVKNIKKN